MTPMMFFWGGLATAGVILAVAVSLISPSNNKPSAVSRVVAAVGFAPEPDKLGWMDDATLTASDVSRIAAVKGMGSPSDGIHLLRGGLTRRDFELLRQDRRRARAAYPDVNPDNLTFGKWMPVSLDAKVPSKWGGGNQHSTQGKDGEWYLDGGTYISLVRAEFPDRASAKNTNEFFANLKIREREQKIARLKERGPFAMWGGSGGSMSVHLDKATGMVVVTRAQEWAARATKWTMPFVADEWAAINESDLEEIKKLPSFASAVEEEISVEPSGVRIGPMTSGGRQFDGMLMPGESVTVSTGLRR